MPLKTCDHAARIAAAERLAAEQLFPLNQLTTVSGVSAQALMRYVAQGKGGVRLDAVKHPEKGFLSSVEAVFRFRAAVAQTRAERGA